MERATAARYDAAVTQTKDQIAARLAETHYILESGIRDIFRIRSDATEDGATDPIKLLEVNADTVPAGILPVYFRPRDDRGIPYPTVIVDITPDEFDRLQARELALPDGWRVGEAFPRPAGE